MYDAFLYILIKKRLQKQNNKGWECHQHPTHLFVQGLRAFAHVYIYFFAIYFLQLLKYNMLKNLVIQKGGVMNARRHVSVILRHF